MCLYSFTFVQWAPKDASTLQQSAGRKRILTSIATQGHSRSFILQSVTGRQGVAYRHIILLALSLNITKTYPLKSPKIAVVDNCALIWRTRQEQPPWISPHTLLYPETRIIGLHFCRWQYGSIFIQVCAVGSKKRIVLRHPGHPRSMILVPIESAYATSYSWLIVTLVLSCTVSEIRRLIG